MRPLLVANDPVGRHPAHLVRAEALDDSASATRSPQISARTLRRKRCARSANPNYSIRTRAQFISEDWIDTLEEAGVKICMDGEGRWQSASLELNPSGGTLQYRTSESVRTNPINSVKGN